MRQTYPFDTHSYVKRLVVAGVPEAQAEIHAEVFVETIIERLATKDDLTALEERIRAEIRAQLSDLRSKLRSEMKDMELRLTMRKGAMIAAGVFIAVALGKLL